MTVTKSKKLDTKILRIKKHEKEFCSIFLDGFKENREITNKIEDLIRSFPGNNGIMGDMGGLCEVDENGEYVEQILWFSYIACIPLEDIEYVEPWNPTREKEVKKWADKRTLNRKILHSNGGTNYTYTEDYSIPRVSRIYNPDLKIEEQNKFKISDGIHRINEARNIGLDCILCHVTENISVKYFKNGIVKFINY